MKMSVTAWTNLECDIEDHDDSVSARLLVAKIETRTFGKRWSQEVSIAINKDEQAIIDKARAVQAALEAQVALEAQERTTDA